MSLIGKAIRLERIIDRKTRRTIIVPMDHGMSVGPIKGLEKLKAMAERKKLAKPRKPAARKPKKPTKKLTPKKLEKQIKTAAKQAAKKQAERLGIETETVDITSALEAFGTYQKRDSVIREIFPEYNNSYKIKITLPTDLLSKDTFNFFTLTILLLP